MAMPITVVEPTQVRLLTVEEWVQHPDADQYELVDGVLRARMVNQNHHEFAMVRAARMLDVHLEDRAITGGVFGSNTKYRVRARRGIMPDVSVVLGPKLGQMGPESALNTVGPDLAVEVLSPDQGADYIDERLDDYWKLGTTEIWIVNPWARALTGYARGEQGFELFAQTQGEEEFSSRLLDGLTFSIGRLWMPRP
jgi:Uma2 family endonuclease